MHGRLPRLTVVVVMLLIAPSPAPAGPPTDEVRRIFTRAERVRQDIADGAEPVASGQAAIRTLLAERFDVEAATRRALGPAWDQRTPSERADMGRLFGPLLEHACLSLLKGLVNTREPLAIAYERETVRGPTAVVATSLQARDGERRRLDYSMRHGSAGWRIQDVVIDGVSVVDNYRAQFARILERSSYTALVDAVRNRTLALPGTDERGPARPAAVASAWDVYFASGRATPDDRAALAGAGDWLRHHPGAHAIVEGHADARGSRAQNVALARERAERVRDWLVAQGVEASRLTVVGSGTAAPACATAAETCWAQNRRVRIRITTP